MPCALTGRTSCPSTKKHGITATIFGVVKEPMFLLLLACGLIYLVLGDIQEAIMLLGFVVVIMGITIYQEQKTENTLEALRDLSSPRALVIRDGERRRIAGREVVRGDLIVLAEGDRVPADAVLLWGVNLSVDESLLTGESAAVRKNAADQPLAMERPGGEDTPFVYSGTLVVHGQGGRGGEGDRRSLGDRENRQGPADRRDRSRPRCRRRPVPSSERSSSAPSPCAPSWWSCTGSRAATGSRECCPG